MDFLSMRIFFRNLCIRHFSLILFVFISIRLLISISPIIPPPSPPISIISLIGPIIPSQSHNSPSVLPTLQYNII